MNNCLYPLIFPEKYAKIKKMAFFPEECHRCGGTVREKQEDIMRKFWRVLALMLAVSVLLCCLAACGGGAADTTKPGNQPGKDTTTSGGDNPNKWDGVDFKGDTLRISVSVNQDSEVTFQPGDRYLRGADTLSTQSDEVEKAVFNRNRNVARALNIEVVYSETDLAYDAVPGELDKIMQTADANAPDIFNNDIWGLTKGMMQNYFYNVVNPVDENGNALKNYIDVNADCWMTDFMKGMTLDESKIYMLAGDYFLDIIRMAWVFYVNIGLFEENFGGDMGYDLTAFYQTVEEGNWTYEEMAGLSETVWRDTGKVDGEADMEDEVVGVALNHCSWYIFSNSSGLPKMLEKKNGEYSVMTSNAALGRVLDKFIELLHGAGVYYEYNVLTSTQYFMNGNVLFAMSVLGEMESEEMRALTFKKGVVPFPKVDTETQEVYHTTVHDQAEIGAILNTTSNYTMVSAYLQYINEESANVLTEYYENSLKLRYNDDRQTAAMIDLVHDSINSPFSMVMEGIAFSGFVSSDVTSVDYMVAAQNKQNTFATDYVNRYDPYCAAFRKMQEAFEALDE